MPMAVSQQGISNFSNPSFPVPIPMTTAPSCSAAFLATNEENGDFNQYWYSPQTISRIADEINHLDGRVAFLSTPSLYFSVSSEVREKSYVFDFDRKWCDDRGFVFFDFNAPDIPVSLQHSFDIIVIDPPFVTSEVWLKYASVAKLLANEQNGAKYILTTISENAELLSKEFQATPTKFQPSIPNLVYQYNLFTNYESGHFNVANPEIVTD